MRTGWALLKRYILTPALDLVFPPVCIGCGRVGVLLCPQCIAGFTPAPTAIEHHRMAPLVALCAVGQFGGTLQQAIHALKYDHITDLAHPLGALMASRIRQAAWPRSLIVAVPLHENRLRQRGYNQSALLGGVIAGQLGWPHRSDLILRARATPSQVGLNYQERQENVKGAFTVINATELQGSEVILIDDVYTTGATIRECATTLLAAGASTVRAMVVGQAIASA